MKKIIHILSFFIFIIFISCTTNPKTSVEKTFHVWGNNDTCKKTIEKACSLNGVNGANWNKDSKLLKFKIDTAIITTDAVLKSVANAGYDNELFYGNDYAYSNLPQACQYERRDN